MASCCASAVYSPPESSLVGSSSIPRRGKGSAFARFTSVGNHSLSSSHSAQRLQHRRPQPATAQGGVSSSPQQRWDDLGGCAAQQISKLNGRYALRVARMAVGGGGAGWEKGESSVHQKTRGREGIACRASGRSNVGSLYWMSKANPYEVLGVSADACEEDVKSAFRARIKEYHPDVYQGLADANAITQRLLQAYEILVGTVERPAFIRKSLDPFEEPECVAQDVFVNELACIGRGCPYSCVERAPEVFQFASDTGRARAINQDVATRKGGEYHVQLAVGQCPNNCIHYMTPAQRFRLEEILESVLEGTVYSSEVVIMEGLIARANFENGRYRPPKRKPTKTEKWVDWY